MESLRKAFEDRISPEPNTGCWIWIGSTFARGYGRYRNAFAHRISHELHKGPIPDGLVIDHLCRNHWCVNPDHLEAVTQQVNTLRGIGPTARNSRKTHCPRGHPLKGTNLRLKYGKRYCRECDNKLTRERMYRKYWEEKEAQRGR